MPTYRPGPQTWCVPGPWVDRPGNSERVDIFPEAPAVRHWHPGEEVIFVLDGTLEYEIEGQEPQTVSAGEALTVPAETVHAVKNVGGTHAAELTTYVVEKGKPFLRRRRLSAATNGSTATGGRQVPPSFGSSARSDQ